MPVFHYSIYNLEWSTKIFLPQRILQKIQNKWERQIIGKKITESRIHNLASEAM
jgi:hypothetical protein